MTSVFHFQDPCAGVDPQLDELTAYFECADWRLAKDWDSNVKFVKKFATCHGHLPDPVCSSTDTGRSGSTQELALWFQKEVDGVGSATAEKKQALDELIACYPSSDELRWEARADDIESFAKQFGHLPPESGCTRRLGSWLRRQRVGLYVLFESRRQRILRLLCDYL